VRRSLVAVSTETGEFLFKAINFTAQRLNGLLECFDGRFFAHHDTLSHRHPELATY